MPKTPEEALKENRRKLVILSLVDAPGMIMLALGFHGKFSKTRELLHPLLEDETVYNSLIIIGGVIVLLGIVKSIALAIERKEIEKSMRSPTID